MIPPFRAIRTATRDLQKLQDALSRVFNSLLSKPLIDGRLLNGIELLSSGSNQVNHGLGQSVRGWIVVSQNADARIWESTSDLPNTTLTLETSNDVTVNLWLF
jgi:hypothetical protein